MRNSSEALNTARLSSLQPAASGPAAILEISPSVKPAARAHDVMRPFVFGADQIRRAHNEQFSRPGRQTRFTPQVRSERCARGVQTWVLEHSGVKIQRAPVLADLWGDHLALLLRYGSYAWFGQSWKECARLRMRRGASG